MRALGRAETRALLERHGLRAKTSLGQHFIIDPNTIRKIVELARVAPGDRIIEVGPGLGTLTVALLDAAADVIALETDRSLEPVLAETAPAATIVWGDAMRLDPVPLAGRGAAMVANLPYQVATPLLVEWLARAPRIRSYTVMVQREVGERLTAAPGEDAYGAVSAKIALNADAQIVSRISRNVFHPMPEVESVLVRLERLPRPRVAGGRARIVKVIESGFAQRRKTIRNALRSGGWDAATIDASLERASIDGTARAETLSIHDFGRLARALPAR